MIFIEKKLVKDDLLLKKKFI